MQLTTVFIWSLEIYDFIMFKVVAEETAEEIRWSYSLRAVTHGIPHESRWEILEREAFPATRCGYGIMGIDRATKKIEIFEWNDSIGPTPIHLPHLTPLIKGAFPDYEVSGPPQKERR